MRALHVPLNQPELAPDVVNHAIQLLFEENLGEMGLRLSHQKTAAHAR